VGEARGGEGEAVWVGRVEVGKENRKPESGDRKEGNRKPETGEISNLEARKPGRGRKTGKGGLSVFVLISSSSSSLV
jgi:hypothetical protein